ncbi:MAG: sulfatase-like hydrolase/transferase, partial [Niameybacter sp.]
PVCQPARAALFTGQYPRSTGGWTNSMGIGQDVQSIGQRLSDHGIHTAYIGKWHLDGGDYFGMGRCPAGGDSNYWYDMRNYLEELTPQERVASRKHATISNGDGIEASFTYGHRCSNRANDYIFMEFGRFEVDHDGFGGVQLVRATFDGRYKLVINLLTSDELYDLEADPYEEIRNRLHDALLEEMNTSRDPFRGYYWERRPWRVNARKVTWAYTGMTRQKQNEEYEPKQLDYSTGLEMTEAVRCK